MSERLQLRQARRLVVKIGSALLTNDGKGLDVAALGLWVDQIAELIAEGVETPEEAAALSEAGVDLMQGYLYGEPQLTLSA